MASVRDRLEAGEEFRDCCLTSIGIEPRWPAEMWWCTDCGETATSDPCDFCGKPIRRYGVVPVNQIDPSEEDR